MQNSGGLHRVRRPHEWHTSVMSVYHACKTAEHGNGAACWLPGWGGAGVFYALAGAPYFC